MLTLLAGAAVACSSGSRTTTAEPTGSPRGTTSSGGDARESPSPRRSSAQTVEDFEPLAGDAFPNAKRLAGRFVQALTTYDGDTAWREIFNEAARPRDRLFKRAAAMRRAEPLFVRGARSRGEIVYPQLGGLAFGTGLDRCALMVVVRQDFVEDNGTARSVTRTVDVRLINRDDGWTIEDFRHAGGREIPRPNDLSEAATGVLDSDRITLPDSARWDIHAGKVDERLLRQMLAVSQTYTYSVAVLKNGHPTKVFGTDRVSGHTQGRACDIWQINGMPVVLQQPDRDTDAHVFTTRLLDDGVPELGSPWDLDGPPTPGETRPSFTDAVHADHIHVAFKAR